MSDFISLDAIVALAKRRGFVYPTSEIYGGLANSYDYGPLGAELLRNLRNLWWDTFIHRRSDMVGLDSQILLNPETWVASGHVASFTDPLVEDKVTHERFRADHVIEAHLKDHPQEGLLVEDLTVADMAQFIKNNNVVSPKGNPITEPKDFNILFETAIGTVVGDKAKIYLRGETAQGIFTNFKQVLNSTRMQVPFGIGQIGKSFRNEITTGQFIFRTLEMEQAEIEYFFNPETTKWQDLMDQWKDALWRFVTQTLGVSESDLQWRRHTDKERSHYSLDTYDLDYRFPFGFKELWGIAYRTDYDLKAHAEHSGQDLSYLDPQTNKRFVPHVIEPAVGLGRLFLMVLTNAYSVEPQSNRVILKLKPTLAPYQVAVFPLLKNKPDLVERARKLYDDLKPIFNCVWDDRGNIGKRYYYQDEIGTPWCVTVDFNTLKDDTVTVRDRDTGNQERLSSNELQAYFKQLLSSV